MEYLRKIRAKLVSKSFRLLCTAITTGNIYRNVLIRKKEMQGLLSINGFFKLMRIWVNAGKGKRSDSKVSKYSPHFCTNSRKNEVHDFTGSVLSLPK